VSLVIPTRHEASTIEAFLERTFQALDGIASEIIVVDDSDRDNTVEVLERVQARRPDHIVVLHRPQGSVGDRTLGTAIVTGLQEARGTYACVIDADGQHPPEAIPQMLAAAQDTEADYVGASRYVTGGSAEGLEGTSRKLISIGLALTTRLAFLFTPIRTMTDPLSGFFLFRRSIAEHVELRPIGWKIGLEVLARCRPQRVVEVPYRFSPRAGGDSKATIAQGLQVLRHIVVLVLSQLGSRRSSSN
jgi:dolichol-phosphate mannosyltransferase